MRIRRLLAVAVAVPLSMVLLGAGYVGILYLKEPRASRPPKPAISRLGRWDQDVAYLAQELPRLHANAFHHLSRPAFDSAIANLRAALPTLSDNAIRVRIAAILAQIGDGHTSSSPRPPNERSFPIRLRGFTDGVFVVRTAPGFEQLQGARVLRVGNGDLDQALTQIASLISHDDTTSFAVAAPPLLSSPAVLAALGLAPSEDSASFLFGLQTGEFTHLTLPALSIAPNQWQEPPFHRPLYLLLPREPFWIQDLRGARTVYIRYNHCRDPFGFWQLSRELKHRLATGEVRRVIIDLRGNSGGNSVQLHYFMLPLLRPPPGVDSWRVYGLVDRETFSSAATNAAQLRVEGDARLVGEPLGGHALGFGEGRSFELPNSHITVWFASQYLPPGPLETVTGRLIPDVVVATTAMDYFSGKDPVLAAALADSGFGGAE